MSPLNMRICVNRVEPGYDDVGLCVASSTESDILWYQLILSLLTITLYYSAITILVYNDTK